MADTKISGELAAGTLDGTELTEVVQLGNNRKATLSQFVLLAKNRNNFYIRPTSGNTITATSGQDTFVVDPVAELGSLHVVLPPTPRNGQIFEVSSTKTIDAFNVLPGSGETVLGPGPFILSANGGVAWRYLVANTTWYRRF